MTTSHKEAVPMRIALAYPFDGHGPDDEIEVDADLGRQLIGDGRARPSAASPLTKPTKKEPTDG